MKNLGKCPKCGSQDILVCEPNENRKEKNVADYEKIGLIGGKIYTTRYICCDCGYTERYFDGKELEKIKKKYRK